MTYLRTVSFSFILSLLLCASAGAQTPTPTPGTGLRLTSNPSGLSNFADAVTSGTTTSLAKIFGGYAGAHGGCASASANSTCSSCEANLKACNETSIHPALLLSIPLVSNTATSFQNNPQVRYKLSSMTTTAAISNTVSLVAGQGFVAQIPWSDLCSRSTTNDANCGASFTDTLSVGITNSAGDTFLERVDFNIVFAYADSTNPSVVTPCVPPTQATSTTIGICGFSVGRGDSKVYINNLYTSSNTLATPVASIKFDRLKVYYVQESATTTITALSPSVVLNLQNNDPNEPSITDPRIRGLTNGVNYCFALANMDQAGNIQNFPDPSVLTSTCAKPDQVVGLLDDKSCFIATATFGSQMAPEVVTFRQFRNRFLLTNDAGRAFVKAYYKYGPIGAEWITQHESLKFVSLALLWPLLLFVKLSLALGLIPSLLLTLMGSVVILRVFKNARRSRGLSA